MMVLRCSFPALATTIFAIATSAAPNNVTFPGSKSVNVLHLHVGTTSKESYRQQRMAALEDAIGEPQRTIHDPKVSDAQLITSNSELKEINRELKESNAKLRSRRIEMELWIGELKQLLAECQSSLTYERNLSKSTSTTSPASYLTSSIATTSSFHTTTLAPPPRPTSPAVSDERRKALSKDLYEAALKGNAQKVRQLVTEGANFEYRTEDGVTALIEAAGSGHVDALKVLIELGAPLETGNYKRETALLYAVWNRREDCVRELLKAGANVNVKNTYEQTPLHWAVEQQSRPIVEMLIAAGADRGAVNWLGKLPKDYTVNATLCALL